MVTATRTPTRNRYRSTAAAAGATATATTIGGGTGRKRNNFEFDAPQWEDFTLPQYAQQRTLLEAVVYTRAASASAPTTTPTSASAPTSTLAPQTQSQEDDWTVTRLLIPREGEEEEEEEEEEDGEEEEKERNNDRCHSDDHAMKSVGDDEWFQRPHAEHEPTSPYTPAGPLISPSPGLSSGTAIATVSPLIARSGPRDCPSSLGRDREVASMGGGTNRKNSHGNVHRSRHNPSSAGSLSRVAGTTCEQSHSSPRPVLRGRPLRVPRPGGMGAVAKTVPEHGGGATNYSPRPSRTSGVGDTDSSRGSFMSILSADGVPTDVKSPLSRRRERRRGEEGRNNGTLAGQGQTPRPRHCSSSSPSLMMTGSPRRVRGGPAGGFDGLSMTGSPMLGSPLVRAIGRDPHPLETMRLPRTSASIEESLMVAIARAEEEGEDDYYENGDRDRDEGTDKNGRVRRPKGMTRAREKGESNPRAGPVGREDVSLDPGRDNDGAGNSNWLPTNWSSSIPATPPILTASLLRLLDQASQGDGDEDGAISMDRQPSGAHSRAEGEGGGRKSPHAPLPLSTRGGIGSRAIRVPAVHNPSLVQSQIQVPVPAKASPLHLPIVKRVKVDGRFCPVPPPSGRASSKSTSPPPSGNGNLTAMSVSSTAPPALAPASAALAGPATRKDRPVKLDDLKKLLAEHNQKLRPHPHPHNNITRRR